LANDNLKNAIVIVKTSITHDLIPTTFLPFLFETAD